MSRRALLPLAIWLCSCAPRGGGTPSAVQVVVPTAIVEATPEQRANQAGACVPRPRPQRPLLPIAEVTPNPKDPTGGVFALNQALAGLRGGFPLVATLQTSEGTLTCELWEHVAPRTVASFVGLARGLRPFEHPLTGRWETRPAYDGTTFHRVIRGFMIQGGDPAGTGRGEPGFVLPDEIDPDVDANRRGLLYMANRGPNTNGMQFFILDEAAAHVGGRYTAFGECDPSEIIERIASVKTGAGDRPVEPVTITRVSIALEGPCAGP